MTTKKSVYKLTQTHVTGDCREYGYFKYHDDAIKSITEILSRQNIDVPYLRFHDKDSKSVVDYGSHFYHFVIEPIELTIDDLIGLTFTHEKSNKSATITEIVLDATSDEPNICDIPLVVIYKCSNFVWSRPFDEFFDSRYFCELKHRDQESKNSSKS